MSFEAYVSQIPEYNTTLNVVHSKFDKIMSVFGLSPTYFAVPQAGAGGSQLIIAEKAPPPPASYSDGSPVDTNNDLTGADPDQQLFLHFWVPGMSGFQGIAQSMLEFKRESVRIGCLRLVGSIADAGGQVERSVSDDQVAQVTAILEG